MSGKNAVVVHPEDINLADAKAMAAKYDTHVVANQYCPRGKAFLMPYPERPVEMDQEAVQ